MGHDPMAGRRPTLRSSRMAHFRRIQPALEYAVAHLDEEVSLADLADLTGLSAFHLHRIFSSACGETPKRLLLRIRIERAAVLLLVTRDSILDVALSCGFQSHEVFLRAFRRYFGVTPGAYRRRGFTHRVDAAQAEHHAALVRRVGPCVGLYHITPVLETTPLLEERRSETMYSITVKELEPRPALVVRRRVKPSEIGSALAEMLPHVFMHAQQAGTALAGQPFTRYLEWGPGLVTMEAGMEVAAPDQDPLQPEPEWSNASGAAEVTAVTLPGGLVATTTHTGAYERLPEAHAAVEQWIEAQGLTAAGPPWESYTTDPADFPDPSDWKTELFWPVTR